MIIIISPAKIQNFKSQQITENYTLPVFMKEAEQLVNLMRELDPSELSKLLEINTKLTDLNYDRFFNWHVPFTLENAKQAAFVFDGEVFRGLQASSFTPDELEYAQQHLVILSGLYGALRPLDLIQAYRLDVSSALKNKYGKDLYPFWQQKVTNYLLQQMQQTNSETLINLASSEYNKTLLLKGKNIHKIDIEFFEYKNDAFKQIVIYTKKARGLMARFLLKNKIVDTEDIKGFNDEGYWFYPQLSNENKYVFVR
ncbi:MAG: peroxide stress protein YaaA [Paludibacter sp.]